MSRIFLLLSCTAALFFGLALTSGCAVKETKHEYQRTDEPRTERRVEVERYERYD